MDHIQPFYLPKYDFSRVKISITTPVFLHTLFANELYNKKRAQYGSLSTPAKTYLPDGGSITRRVTIYGNL